MDNNQIPKIAYSSSDKISIRRNAHFDSYDKLIDVEFFIAEEIEKYGDRTIMGITSDKIKNPNDTLLIESVFHWLRKCNEEKEYLEKLISKYEENK